MLIYFQTADWLLVKPQPLFLHMLNTEDVIGLTDLSVYLLWCCGGSWRGPMPL